MSSEEKLKREMAKKRLTELAEEIKKQEIFRKTTTKEISFSHLYAPRDEKVYLMLPNFANEYQVSDEIKTKFMNYRLMRKEAFTTSRIKRTAFKHVRFENTDLTYTIYEVRREDDQTYYFCDNDLLSINPSDLLVLGKCMKNKIKATEGILENVAYSRIVNCMQNFVRHRMQVDFQIGLEHKVEKLSISAPNEDREGIDKLPAGFILTEPEDGIVFRRPEKKCFFRISEAHKYSEEIVDIVKSYASHTKEDTSKGAPIRIAAERMFKKLDQLKRLRSLTDVFNKICTNHPEAPF